MCKFDFKEMFDLPSFAISIAANIVYGCINSGLLSVDKEVKAAYKAAEEKFFPDESLRGSVSIDRKLRLIKREIAQIITEPDKRDSLDGETLAFLKLFEKEIATRPEAYRYLKEITDRERYNEVIDCVGEISVGVKTAVTYLESAHISPFIPYKLYVKQSFKEDFCSNQKLDEVIRILKGTAKTIRLVALSGMGKSRVIREAFRSEPDIPLYYCEVFESRTQTAAQNIFLGGGPCIMILDNCPLRDFLVIKDLRDRYNQEIRLISVYNDPSEMERGDIELIKLEKDDLKSVVEAYLIKRLGRDNENFQRLCEFSDGIPYMAILLADALLVEKLPAGYISDDTLLDRLLGLDEKNPDDLQTKRILEAYSLFHPLGYDGEYAPQLNYVANDPNIAPLNVFDPPTRVVLFKEVCERYKKRQLMEHLGNWVNVRPLPLAVWLLNQWFRHCTEDSIFGIIQGIQALPEYHSKALNDAFARRIIYLADNDLAQHTLANILKPEAPFGNAKVVNTPLGSRLFRSFAQVNPVATSDILYYLYANAPIDDLLKIEGDIRRNLVWTLESLCFAKASFTKAAKILAKFAIAENETWSNNAVGTFIHLFQILLSGTEADLTERFAVIRYCYQQGKLYQELTLKAIGKALDNGSFHRSRGAEKQGLKVLKDYEPSGQEIYSYWENCVNLLIEWMGKDKEITERGAEIVNDHARSLYRAGCAGLFLKLLECFADAKGNDWEEMLDTLYTIVNYDFKYGSESCNEQVRYWVTKLTKQDFYSRFCHVQKYGRQHEKMDWKKIIEAQGQLYQELAEEYVEKWWDDEAILNSFYENSYPLANSFVSRVCELEVQQPVKSSFFISKSLEVLDKEELPAGYPFFVYYCHFMKDEELKKYVIQRLTEQKRYKLLFAVAAVVDKDLKYFHRLIDLVKKEDLSIDYFKLYINYKMPENEEERLRVYSEILDLGNEGAVLLIPYLNHLSYNRNLMSKDAVVKLIQKCVLMLPFDDTLVYDRYDVVRMAERALENGKEADFAVRINQKIITSLKTITHYYNLYDSIYQLLIKKYGEVIWDDLSHALLTDNENYMIYHCLSRILGSGIGLGAGPLFMYDDEKLLNWCRQNPTEGPERLAEMVPVYKYATNEAGETRATGFSSVILKLLDEFGSQEEVLSALEGNMNSFSWTGSVIPLYRQKIMALEQLLNHPRAEVVEWAERGIQRANREIEYETKRESYEQLTYGE